jgi:hypothetical protein
LVLVLGWCLALVPGWFLVLCSWMDHAANNRTADLAPCRAAASAPKTRELWD